MMCTKLWALCLMIVVALGLPGCSPVTLSPVETPTTLRPTDTPAPVLEVLPISPKPTIVEEVIVPVEPTVPVPAGAATQHLVTLAKEDLADRLNAELEAIELIEFRAVVWPDGGLGCPQPGMAYIQVQQEGALIRLRAGKQIYHYHSGGNREPFLCRQTADVDDTLLPPPGYNE